jgi:PKD repeat protein
MPVVAFFLPAIIGAAAPVADCSAIPPAGFVLLTVTLTDTLAYTPASWLWDFGNGTKAPYRNPIHTCVVNLTVTGP